MKPVLLLVVCCLVSVAWAQELTEDEIRRAEQIMEDAEPEMLEDVELTAESGDPYSLAATDVLWWPFHWCRPQSWLITKIRNCVPKGDQKIYGSRCIGYCRSGASVNWGNLLWSDQQISPGGQDVIWVWRVNQYCDCCKPVSWIWRKVELECKHSCQCSNPNCTCPDMPFTKTLFYRQIRDCDCVKCRNPLWKSPNEWALPEGV